MNREDGFSSEGIVCSSDDEYDGLSEAVEHHIIMQENNTTARSRDTRSNSMQEHHRGDGYGSQRQGRPLESQHPHPVDGAIQQYQFFSQHKYHKPGRYLPGNEWEHNHKGPGENALNEHNRSPPKRTLFTPRPDIMRRHFRDNIDTRHLGILPPNVMRLEVPAYIENLGMNTVKHAPPRPLVHANVHQESIQPRTHDKVFFPGAGYDTHQIPEHASVHYADHNTGKKIKSLPKPVTFKIKSNPPPRLEKRHPLDPFSPVFSGNVEEQGTGPRKWSHDRYEDEHQKCVKSKPVEEQRIQDSSRVVRRNEKGRRKKRSRTSSPVQSPVNMKNDSGKNPGKRTRARKTPKNKLNSGSSPSISRQTSNKIAKTGKGKTLDHEPDRKVTIVREDEDVVYEEVILVDDDDIHPLHEVEIPSDSEDDEELLGLRLKALSSALPANVDAPNEFEEDDELLGLRLNALTSALDSKSRANKEKDTQVEIKKPKHPLRRIVERPRRTPRRRRKNKKSDITDSFLKQYNAISKDTLKNFQNNKASIKSPTRKVAINYNAPQLTLFGEIVKNHQTTTKADALRYIRHHPNASAKTDIFLNLMRRDALDVSEAVDLHKQNLNMTKLNKGTTNEKTMKQKLTETSTGPQTNKEIDNYDEIEMDLDNGDSDSDLVPPGTDISILEAPTVDMFKTIPKPFATVTLSTAQDTAVLNSTVVELKEQSLLQVPATPSQESIWSMLEHSIVTNKEETLANEHNMDVDKRARIPSEDAEIDDDSLVILREKLLQQMDKNQPKEQPLTSDFAEKSSLINTEIVSTVVDKEVNLLPSRYPYQPPTLTLKSLLNNLNPTQNITPTTIAVSKELSVQRPNTRASAALKTGVATTKVSSSTVRKASTSKKASYSLGTVTPPLHILNPGAFISGLGNIYVNSSSDLTEETKAAIAMSSIDMSTHFSKAFKPSMSSTPLVSITPKAGSNQTNPTSTSSKKARRRRIQQRKRVEASAKAALAAKNESAAVLLNPATTDITTTPKKHSPNIANNACTKVSNQPLTVAKPTQLSKKNTQSPKDTAQPSTITTQASEVTTHSSKITTQSSIVTSQPSNASTLLSGAPILLAKASTQPQKITTQPTKITPQPSKITTQPSEVTTQPSKITTQPSTITTQPSTITTQPSKITTQLSKITTQPSIIISQPSKVSTQLIITQTSMATTRPSKASTQSAKASTQPSKTSTQPLIMATTQPSKTSTQLSKITTQSSMASTQPSIVTTQLKKVTTQQSKATTRPSQTVFKSATTLIKSSRMHIANKRPAESSSPDSVKRKVLVMTKAAVEKPAHLRLPRHQPVVVNIGGSSDEDDSIVSPSRNRHAGQNPLDFHKNMLEAMIKQAREQTAFKQTTKLQPSKQETPMEYQSTSQHSIRSLDMEIAAKKMQLQSKLQSKPVGGGNPPTKLGKPPTPAALKSVARQQKQLGGKQNHLDTASHLKQTRAKFLKLKTLIGVDEVSYSRLIKIKESKRSELKVVEDELKEMIHRVAAIKGKATRCEELIKRYNQKEMKIKSRLEKRNKLKLELKERIKRQMLKARSEQREKKANTPIAAADTDLDAKTATIAVTVSPVKLFKQEKLDQEKQRLLAMEQQLAVKINKMKKSDGKSAAVSRRRVSLSREVQTNLAKYKKTKQSSNPTAHDLSLSKIAISNSSPVRNIQSPRPGATTLSINSPARKLINSPASSRGSSPVVQRNETKASMKISTDSEQISAKPIASAVEKKSDVGSEMDHEKLRKHLQHNLTDSKSLLGYDQPFPDSSQSAKSWHKSIPDFFKKWKIDIGELLFQNSREEKVHSKSYKFQSYESPLRNFRSYRLSPFLRMKERLMIKSRTFSHKINPERILCRYDLTGTCQDPNCKAQHVKQYDLTSSELILDLLSYCPDLLGDKIKQDSEYKDMIQLAESACNKLCGISNSQPIAMSIDEKCILIASKVNTTLGNKAPFTTNLMPRKIKTLQDRNKLSWKSYLQQDGVAVGDVIDDGNLSFTFTKVLEHPDSFIKDEERYFIEQNPGDLHRIDEALKQNPNDIQLWLELAYKKMQKRSGSQQSSLEIGLHTMCLALEDNPYVGELWGHYLGLLKRRKGTESEQDREEMVSQANELVPLSTHVWNQLLSWDSDIIKREFLFDQLISNLLKNVEEGGDVVNELSPEVTSRWLLQTVLQRVQLQLISHSIDDVLSFLEMTVKNFSQQCRTMSTAVGNSTQRCLTPNDLSSLWLCYINIKNFKTIPQCFLPCASRSDTNIKNCLGVVVIPGVDVQLHFNAKNKLDTIAYCDLCADLNIAIKECSSSIYSIQLIESIGLIREKLRLEMFQQYWDTAAETCELLWNNVSEAISAENVSADSSQNDFSKLLTEFSIIWADIMVRKGNISAATQIFENAVIKNPSDPQLCYEAALFQLNQESTDVDEVLLYFESCASAYLNIEKDTLTATELKDVFHFLLRLPMPLSFKAPVFASGMTREFVKKKKAYLWLIYIILLELSGETANAIMDYYEKTIIDVDNEKDQQQIWLKYLKYRQMDAPNGTESSSKLTKSRQIWMKNFTAVVRRCLSTSSYELRIDNVLDCDSRFSDYSFHNEVSLIYLSCFHARHQISTAYIFLAEMMPYNVPLLLRACQHFLSFDDQSTIMSILWKVTSNTLCQDRMIWKISVAAHFTRERIAKAIHLCRRSVEAIPYSHEMWTDYLTILKAYGKPGDFTTEKNRCSSILQIDASRLLPTILA